MIKSKKTQVHKKMLVVMAHPMTCVADLTNQIDEKVKCKPDTAFWALPNESLLQQPTSMRDAVCQFSILSPDIASLTSPFTNLSSLCC